MDNENSGICPLCGEGTSEYMECTDFAVTGETFRLHRCSGCGLIMTGGTPAGTDREEYSKLNQEMLRANNPSALLDRLYYIARLVTVRRKVRFVEEMTRMKRGRLLNYGAKNGFFSSRMSDRGWKVTSLEEQHEKRAFSLEMFHHRMMDTEELDSLPHSSYDAVTLWHTFEHQDNPLQLLDKFSAILKHNGLLFIAVPNTDSLDAAYYGKDWAAWDVPRHLWHFNPQSMVRAGIAHGLVLLHHKRMPFDVFYISALSETYRNGNNISSVLRGLRRGFGFWLHTNSRRSGSSSIVYVFRKKNN